MKYTIASILCCLAVTATAQDLHKEITVDRTVQPELREAYRLNGVAPAIVAPSVPVKKLSAAEYTSAGTITNEVAQLPPAPWRDSIPRTPYRGYASIGYLPIANLGANAGYTFYETDRAHAGAWLQYDLASYKGPIIRRDDDCRLSQSVLTLGANAAYRISGNSDIALTIKYTNANIGTPYIDSYALLNGLGYEKYGQTANCFDAGMAWRTAHNLLRLKGSLGYEYFGFGDNVPQIIHSQFGPAKQNIVSAALGLGLCDEVTPTPWIGADIDWTVVRNSGIDTSFGESNVLNDRCNYTLGHIHPYLLYGDEESLYGRIGLNASIATGNDRGHVRIAPDIEVNWRPLSYLTIYGKAGGGEYVNRQSTLFALNPYMTNYYVYERSNLAIEIEGGARIVTSAGFRMGVYGGFANGRNRLTPMINIAYDNQLEVSFLRSNVRSWHAGISAGYDYKHLLSVSASVEAGGSNKSYATWQYWTDGAKLVSEIAVTAHPVESLDVQLSYTMRNKRRAFAVVPNFDVMAGGPATFSTTYDLGNVGNLTLGADYRITPRFTAFACIENLLNKHCWLVSGMPAQGIHGLAGIAYKF